MSFALRAFQQKYGELLRPTWGERNSIRDLVRARKVLDLQESFDAVLASGALNPKSEPLPMSAFIAETTGRKPSPKCVPRCHIRSEYFGVYDFAVACSVNTGRCWLSERVTGDWTCRSRDSARRGIQWLVKHGWLDEVNPRHKRRGWRYYQPVTHEDWVDERDRTACATVQMEEVL
jgi:hypothetical protein